MIGNPSQAGFLTQESSFQFVKGWHLQAVSPEGETLRSRRERHVSDPQYSGWFGPQGVYTHVPYSVSSKGSGYGLYHVYPNGNHAGTPFYHVSHLPPYSPASLPNQPILLAQGTVSQYGGGGGLMIWYDPYGKPPFKSIPFESGYRHSDRWSTLGDTCNGPEFLRRFCDFALYCSPGRKPEAVFRLKYGIDGELYCIDRNGCLFRIEEPGNLVRLTGGPLHRLLGNAPTKPPDIPTYGPWAGSRTAFAVGPEGDGRLFDPYSGCLLRFDSSGTLHAEALFPLEFDPAVASSSPFEMPAKLHILEGDPLDLWLTWDSPSSALDGDGNFFLLLHRLLRFSSKEMDSLAPKNDP